MGKSCTKKKTRVRQGGGGGYRRHAKRPWIANLAKAKAARKHFPGGTPVSGFLNSPPDPPHVAKKKSTTKIV